jgi:CheY-like chemotaxis protein
LAPGSRTIKAVAVVKDLFFVARIKETARMVGTPLVFARTSEELTTALADAPDLVILDLTTSGWDYEPFFDALDGAVPRPPVLGFTTHALARVTQTLHARCTRVVTKETLTQELPELLKTGVAA